jgi:putative ABC transport system ATP-binding protein
LIELQSVSKEYLSKDQTRVLALREVSMSVQPGEFVAIMAPSGMGKTTLLNVIGCLDRATSGTYLLDGINVAALSDDELSKIRNKKIGFVFQTFNLLPQFNALENVEVPLLYSGESHFGTRAHKALELVGLGDRLRHFPSELSGGQQQRVAIARALINDPALLLADEPTGNLDTQAGQEIMALFRKLNESGRTIIMVTHSEELAAHAKRMIRMRDGRIEDDRQVVRRPELNATP